MVQWADLVEEVAVVVVVDAAAAVLEWEAEVAWTPVLAAVAAVEVADVAAVEVAVVWKMDRLKFLT